MIKTPTEIPELQAILLKAPNEAVKISAYLAAYGTDCPYFNIWVCDGLKAVIARLDCAFFLHLPYGESGVDFDEIAAFLRLHPCFGSIAGSTSAVMPLLPFLDGKKFEPAHLMRLKTADSLPASDATEINKGYEGIYKTIISADHLQLGSTHGSTEFRGGLTDDFASWYTDISYRVRHGCARAFALYKDKLPVSVCIVGAETAKCALLTAVSTLPDYMHRGYGSQVVAAACRTLLEVGKIPLLECGEKALSFYKRLGFAEISKTAQIIIYT